MSTQRSVTVKDALVYALQQGGKGWERPASFPNVTINADSVPIRLSGTQGVDSQLHPSVSAQGTLGVNLELVSSLDMIRTDDVSRSKSEAFRTSLTFPLTWGDIVQAFVTDSAKHPRLAQDINTEYYTWTGYARFNGERPTLDHSFVSSPTWNLGPSADIGGRLYNPDVSYLRMSVGVYCLTEDEMGAYREVADW